MNTEIKAEKLISWIERSVKDAGAKGVVFGLSGGIDSAVVAAACKRVFPDDSLGIIMPCQSNPQDEEDALIVADALNLRYEKVVLDDVFNSLMKAVNSKGDEPRLAIANIKPRLRMVTLYYHAAINNYLVAGTSNKSELTVGYFTKYGDSGSDIVPLAPFVKHEVWDIARYLGVPEKIIDKKPTAGLWENQTDESEMGITYNELDTYILTGKGEDRVKNTVDNLNKKSRHKREFAKMFKL